MSDNLKVCPGCGSRPWDFAHPGKQLERQPSHCQDCGEKLVLRSELPRDIWKDPYVKQALKEGRPAWDIAVMRCPKCGQFGYYNEGSSFSCRFCDDTYHVDDELSDEVVTLADTVTEITDGYHNQTR